MIELYNWKGDTQQSIYHFQGQSKFHYKAIFEQTSKESLCNDDRLHIMTCATDEDLSLLITQLKTNNIPYINVYEPSYYHEWTNTLKENFILSYLYKFKDDDVIIILDGYDVAIRSLSDIYDKFINSGYRILFNSTKHNYPNVNIDRYRNRDFVGEFRYLNAGCCIGYAKDLIDFYVKSVDFLKKYPTNPWNSEQYVIRHIWANYSELDDRIIDFDHECKIFQTFGSTSLEKIDNSKYKVV